MKLLIKYIILESNYMNTHAIVVSLTSLHYFFLTLMLIKYFQFCF